MRFKCTLNTEKRGLISQDERKLYSQIIKTVFKHVAEGDYSNLYKECLSKDISGVEVNVILTDNEKIREYNRQFRKTDKETDVLSFPASDFVRGETEIGIDNINPENNFVMLGDIIISVEKMKAQALEYGHSESRELAFLTCHSMLHLLGYDHMSKFEENTMNELCEKALEITGYTRDI